MSEILSLPINPSIGTLTIDDIKVESGQNLDITNGDVNISQDLTIDTTTFKVDATDNEVGIGTVDPDAKLHILSTTEQLRLGYDTTNYFSTTVDSSGNTTITNTGNYMTISKSLNLPGNNVVNIVAYGAVGDGVLGTNTTAFNSALTALVNMGGGVLYIPSGTFLIESLWTINTRGVPIKVIGNSKDDTIISAAHATFPNSAPFYVTSNNDVEIHNLTINAGYGSHGYSHHGISIYGSNDVLVRNVHVYNYGGTAILAYHTSGSHIERVFFQNCSCDGVAIGSYGGRNGFLLGEAKYSGMHNCYVENLTETNGDSPCYALQLKNNCQYSYISDSISINCRGGIVCGQDQDPPTEGVTNCTFNNIRIYNPTVWGIALGRQSRNNIFTNINIDMGGSAGNGAPFVIDLFDDCTDNYFECSVYNTYDVSGTLARLRYVTSGCNRNTIIFPIWYNNGFTSESVCTIDANCNDNYIQLLNGKDINISTGEDLVHGSPNSTNQIHIEHLFYHFPRFTSRSTTEQLRLEYDASNYMSSTVSSTGVATLTTTGTYISFTKPVSFPGNGIYSARAFGIVGDGSTDDLAAISSMITSLTTTGYTCYFPPGTYRLSGGLVISASKITLQGAGMKCTTILLDTGTADETIVLSSSSYININDMTIDSNHGVGVSEENMIITNSSYVNCNRLQLQGSRYYGILLDGSSTTYCQIKGCEFYGTHPSESYGLGFKGNYQCITEGCVFYGCKYNIVSTSSVGSYNIVDNCLIDANNVASAIGLYMLGNTSSPNFGGSDDAIFSNITLRNIPAYGIRIQRPNRTRFINIMMDGDTPASPIVFENTAQSCYLDVSIYNPTCATICQFKNTVSYNEVHLKVFADLDGSTITNFATFESGTVKNMVYLDQLNTNISFTNYFIDSTSGSYAFIIKDEDLWEQTINKEISYASADSATVSVDTSAILQCHSTTQGFLPPQMTGTQRDNIASPATGLVVYNTTTNKLNVYTGSGWEAITST